MPTRGLRCSQRPNAGLAQHLATRMTGITAIFQRLANGDSNAFEELVPIVYDELKQIASRQMARESPGQTLQTTELVSEVYLKLVGGDQNWSTRTHFFAAAAKAMRHILVDRARYRLRAKRGGELQRRPLEENVASSGPPPEEVVLVDDLLEKLAASQPEVAEIVKLHYFVGMNISEAGRMLGISSSTAHRHWDYARAWFQAEKIRSGG